MLDVAKILRRRFPDEAKRVPTREIPNFVLRIAALRKPELRMVASLLGQYMQASGDKAKELLKWSPRSSEESIVATAESLLRLGLIKK